MLSFPRLPSLRLIALLASLGAGAGTAENDVRLVPQLAVGTAGVEPGLALEVRTPTRTQFVIRPELLLSEDGHLGGGGAILVDVSTALALPKQQAIAIGPRVVYHHADDSGVEADLMATWGFDLSKGARTWRHAVGILGAVGVRHERRHDEASVGVTAGVFYSYGF